MVSLCFMERYLCLWSVESLISYSECEVWYLSGISVILRVSLISYSEWEVWYLSVKFGILLRCIVILRINLISYSEWEVWYLSGISVILRVSLISYSEWEACARNVYR